MRHCHQVKRCIYDLLIYTNESISQINQNIQNIFFKIFNNRLSFLEDGNACFCSDVSIFLDFR